MRTALIHIGVEKTGTTTIQHNLYENRHVLIKNGIAVLESTGGINNTKIASWCYNFNRVDAHIIRYGIINTEDRIKWRQRFRNELADRLHSLPANTQKVIISGEHFHSKLTTPEEMQRLKELLAPHFQKFVILVYLRRQDQLAMSAFSTSCKSGYFPKPLFQPGIEPENEYYNFYLLLQRWSQVFGKKNIAVKIFEKDQLYRQDVLLDFYRFAGINHKKWGLKNYGSHNVRLSGPAALISSRFLKYNPAYTSKTYNQENEKTNKALISAFESKYGGVQLLPSKASAIIFYNVFKPSNDRVAKEWFDTETLFKEDFSEYPDEPDDFNFDEEDIDAIFKALFHQKQNAEITSYIDEIAMPKGKKNAGSFLRIIQFIMKPKKHYQFRRDKSTIKKSGLFDQDYYLKEYPDVKTDGTEPLTHYILYGAKEHRRPSAFFDTDYYLQANPDVQAAGINPFAHFIKNGWQEGRKPHKHFSINFCLDQLKQREQFSLSDCKPFFDVFTQYRQYDHAVRLKQLISISRTESEYAKQEAYLKDIETLFNLKYFDEFSNEKTNRTERNLAHKLIQKEIFNPRTYIENNHFLSVSNINLFEHYYLHGVNENLKAFSVQAIKRIILKLVTESEPGDYNIADSIRLFLKYKSIGVVCHSESNAFFLEMREYFVCMFQNLGITSKSLNEQDVYKNDFEHFFIIGPHEFFWFFDDEKMTAALLKKSSVYITEQPQSKFYYTRLEKVLDAVHVFDLNLASTWFYQHIINKKSHFFPLGFEKGLPVFSEKIRIENDLKTFGIPGKVKKYDNTIHQSIAERPVDMFFLGSLMNDHNDNRRARFFARNSLQFSKYENLFFLVDGNKPLKTTIPTSLSLMQAAALAQRSKIMLNIHREDFPYFEWHRMVWLGIAQKCLVITEDVMDSPFFEIGKHYLSAPLDEIPALISNILETKTGMEQAQHVVDDAYKILVEHLQFSSAVKVNN